MEALRSFYVDVIGFKEVARPDFETDGYWLMFEGVGLHMAEFLVKERRHGGRYPDRERWQLAHRRIRELRGWDGMPTGVISLKVANPTQRPSWLD